MSNEDARMHILHMIEEGKISADEGLRLLNAMGGKDPAPAAGPAPEPDPVVPPEAAAPAGSAGPAPTGEMARPSTPTAGDDPQMKYWRRWWMIPMLLGAAVTIVASLLMYWAVQLSGFWAVAVFACAWLPMSVGVGAMAMAWASRNSRWVHLRVDRAAGERPRRLALSLPLPVRVVAWGLRTFGRNIPVMKQTAVDELLLALDESATPETPIFIDVSEGEKGERVQVYIG